MTLESDLDAAESLIHRVMDIHKFSKVEAQAFIALYDLKGETDEHAASESQGRGGNTQLGGTCRE